MLYDPHGNYEGDDMEEEEDELMDKSYGERPAAARPSLYQPRTPSPEAKEETIEGVYPLRFNVEDIEAALKQSLQKIYGLRSAWNALFSDREDKTDGPIKTQDHMLAFGIKAMARTKKDQAAYKACIEGQVRIAIKAYDACTLLACISLDEDGFAHLDDVEASSDNGSEGENNDEPYARLWRQMEDALRNQDTSKDDIEELIRQLNKETKARPFIEDDRVACLVVQSTNRGA